MGTFGDAYDAVFGPEDEAGTSEEVRAYIETIGQTIAMAIVADGVATDEELTSAVKIATDLPVLKELSDEEIDQLLTRSFEAVRAAGLDGCMNRVAKSVPDNDEVRAEVWGLAALLMYVDGDVSPPEKEFLERFRLALSLSPQAAKEVLVDIEKALEEEE